MLESRSAAIFPGKENPARVVTMENHFARILEKKRRIVEEVKHRVDLYDQHLATKCLLEGVWPPSWLWPPFIPSQTSELNREKIISGLLFPQLRPSIEQPDSVIGDVVVREESTYAVTKPSIQQRDSVRGEIVVKEDLTYAVNKSSEEQLFEKEQQHSIVRSGLNRSLEQGGNIASLGDVLEVEGLRENVAIGCRENQSCPSLEYSEDQRVENSLDATSPGHIQGEVVVKSVSTAGCERKPSSPGHCQDETEPNTRLDLGLSVAQIQRSRSRQKALELRSSAKASKRRSSGHALKTPTSGNRGLGIASLRSDSVSEIELFQQDESDEECQDEVKNSFFEGKGEDRCIKFSSTTESSTPFQKVNSVRDDYASIVPESPLDFGHVNEVEDPQSKICNETAYLDGDSSSKSFSQDIFQPIETIDGVYAKVDDPQSRSCKETAYLAGGTSSKSLSQDSPNRKLQNSSNSFSGDFQSRNSNSSHWEDHEVKLSQGESFDSDSVTETLDHMKEAACHNLDQYDIELQKVFGSASTDYDVELQKMFGSASSAELQFEAGYLFKDAGLMSPASLSFRPEQLSVQRSHVTPNQGSVSENMEFLQYSGETSHPLASRVVCDSDCSPCLSPLGLIDSDDGSPPVSEGFIIQTDDENQSNSKSQTKCDSFQLPRTTAESAILIEQICKSACRMKSFKFNDELNLDKSISIELLDGMFFSQILEGSSVLDNMGINIDYSIGPYIDHMPFSGTGSSADARNPRTSPSEKLWHRSFQKSSSSEKRGSHTPELPCISEENENVDEEVENLCTIPKFMSSEKLGSSVPDLPCIGEENENIDEISEAASEVSDSKGQNISAEKKPLGDVNEYSMKFLPSVSKAKIPVDRQSLDSVSTPFSFSAKCNNSVKSKMGRKKGGSRRFTGKGKEYQGGAGAGNNVKPPRSRFSKAKLSCSSSLTTLRPRHDNIVSNITSFVPLVQQQKPITKGKRDVKVKALEAAEASKRIAEQKEIDRKMKKEAMKLERARLEQENLRKQEIEKKKKEEDRKTKEAEMAWKQEMEKKKKEEERKRKELEMADRKRQRVEEDRKLKEAKRQRTAEVQRQQREADKKLHAEKELKRQAMDARIKVQKELQEDQINAQKTREQANTRIPETRSKSISSNDTNASRSSRDDDFKELSNLWKMSEESYDISPYKGSDDEEDDGYDDDDMSNNKFVPTWTSKSNVLLNVISQQSRDPNFYFPAKSFCGIRKIVFPRKL